MEIEAKDINTKGYEFYWHVAPDGYEIVNEASYRAPPQATQESPAWSIVSETGFHISEGISPSGNGNDMASPWLIAKQSAVYHRPEFYKPLSNPVLHRKFASLKTENLEAEALGFAGTYGLLRHTLLLHPKGLSEKGSLPPTIGESLLYWQREIDEMGVLLAIWDWIRKGDAGKLGQIVIWPKIADSSSVTVRFQWKRQGGRYTILPWDDLVAGCIGLLDNAFFYQKGDVIGPAREFLFTVLNSHLRGISPSLLARPGTRVSFIPKSLIDALWLMFMLEASGVARACWYCEKPMSPKRKDNVYCSKNCKRMAFYYNNRGS